MKRYKDRITFRKVFGAILSSHDLHRRDINEYHIQVLQDYRIAATFVIPILSLSIAKTTIKKFRKSMKSTLRECRAVLKNDSVFLMSNSDNQKKSKRLESTIRKADEAIIHAGNICYNMATSMPEEIQLLMLEARRLCDFAVRRKRIGDC